MAEVRNSKEYRVSKKNIIVKCEAQQIVVFRFDRKLAISTLQLFFVKSATPSFGQNEIPQTVKARLSKF